MIRRFVVLVVLMAGPAFALPPPRDARHVIFRGARKLADALHNASADAKGRTGAAAHSVAIVVDVTPNTRAASPRLRRALDRLGDKITDLRGRWRIAPLGGRFGPEVRHPSALVMQLDRVLAEETRVPNMIRALTRTLAGFRDHGGIVVYLADWHFEDDDLLEGFIGRLVKRRQSLRVVGSEAAHGRPFREPFWPEVKIHTQQNFALGVGRCPFRTIDPEAPWHGGDTAYPHLPWHFSVFPWRMTFPVYYRDHDADAVPGDGDLPEEIGDRERDAPPETDATGYHYPLASSWGPYGLMRAAAVTGGKYVLWSWNPRGRTNVEYDYGLCNLFPPDLRSRAEILVEIPTRPCAAAMVRAWNLLGSRKRRLVSITAPLEAKGWKVREMGYSAGRASLCFCFPDRRALDTFCRVADRELRALCEAVRVLDRALSRPARRDPHSPRYRADAEHFRHIAVAQVFQLSEALAAAGTIPSRAWDDPDVHPCLESVEFISTTEPDEPVRVSKKVTPFDGDAAAELVRRHADMIDRYRGTPVGVMVAGNSVRTYRVRFARTTDGRPKKTRDAKTPSESVGSPERTPRPPATSGGVGSTTGR